jgi:hypothetical protein
MHCYLLKEKLFSWGGDFSIKNEDGDTAFKVDGKVLTLRDKKVVYDGDQNKLCVIQAKLMSCRPEMQIFTYAPNQEGQKSTDDDEGTPIFRFATVIQDCWNCPKGMSKWTYFAYVGNDDMIPLYRGVTKCACGFTMNITNMQGEVVGKVGQTSVFQFEGG